MRASSWLSALALSEYGFTLHKAAFHDTITLRYGWPLCLTPSHCACGTTFSVDHALSCPKGGFLLLCHNKITDLTARLLTEVCHQLRVEPELQVVSDPDSFSLSTANTQEGARLDIAMNGFGVDELKVALWMSVSSICKLLRMWILSLLHTIITKTLSSVHTVRGSGRLNMLNSLQLWCLLLGV